ncbi:LemA family protein [Acetoanaerobium noterae]|uniref:LemA family protein n=1 Tax=Acetoanaerobium noterae TaxID=745369 RepID=UPI00324213B2
MKKGILGVIIALVVIAGLLVMPLIGSYNNLVTLSENADQQWANVETVLQRRYDLIPNLVESVKGAMAQEQEVFGRIADARSSLLNASSVEDKVEASNQLERGIRDLKVVVENYPELRSNESVTRLMDELAGTENRISVERGRYNETVADYNRKIKRFPTVIIAGMMGFDERAYFEAADGAETAPKVDLTNP